MDSYTLHIPMVNQGAVRRLPNGEKPPVREMTINLFDKPEMERMVHAYRAIGVSVRVTQDVEQTVEVK